MVLGFYAEALMNPHWGEQIRLRRDNTVQVSMVFQGLTRSQAQAVWQPFRDALARAPDDLEADFAPLAIVSTSAREFWSPTLMKRALGFMRTDDRPGAPKTNVFWPGDQGQAGQVLHAFQSAWLPAALLQPEQRACLGRCAVRGVASLAGVPARQQGPGRCAGRGAGRRATPR